MGDFQFVEARDPPLQRFHAVHTETSPTDTVIPMALPRRMRPIEKRKIASRRPLSICIKQVVSADVVLVDRFFDQTHPENVRIKLMVLARISRDCGDVMNSK
jgi:hypothetical protein